MRLELEAVELERVVGDDRGSRVVHRLADDGRGDPRHGRRERRWTSKPMPTAMK